MWFFTILFVIFKAPALEERYGSSSPPNSFGYSSAQKYFVRQSPPKTSSRDFIFLLSTESYFNDEGSEQVEAEWGGTLAAQKLGYYWDRGFDLNVVHYEEQRKIGGSFFAYLPGQQAGIPVYVRLKLGVGVFQSETWSENNVTVDYDFGLGLRHALNESFVLQLEYNKRNYSRLFANRRLSLDSVGVLLGVTL